MKFILLVLLNLRLLELLFLDSGSLVQIALVQLGVLPVSFQESSGFEGHLTKRAEKTNHQQSDFFTIKYQKEVQ